MDITFNIMMKYKKGDRLVTNGSNTVGMGHELEVCEVYGCMYFLCYQKELKIIIAMQEYLDSNGYTLKSRPKDDWTPEIGKQYYYITDSGFVNWLNWDNDKGDNERKDFLGIFRTQAEAEARLQEIKDNLK